ncbi:hypothetical protein F7734_41175 [Scytonema sp. UIC 10036]|uniref:hypothetical protein n=1 Tax=Scytonema sp. UIC 10036 TaxID=2304196 RepID=UPI0012DAAD7E|nr:hypothetical protein [Scytonema sp. UIC 10036]MUG98377.1 hypothetical protein [Scytonema sp. UIC 10036]
MNNYNETESIEDIRKWQRELYELEKYAVSGRGMTQERMDKNVKELLDPNFNNILLEEAKVHKQKLLKDLEWTEKRIQYLINQIEEVNNKTK